ncbi:unnamed protein product [Mytilus coruscus]|uniref:Uncharacterized protein n=1 Tax=Mytilus coruscus TaxID=42192 RepID=A0A6J8EPK1_MYTCO|nr:unnamed protein product [Mytilus coruscus]
MTLKAFLCLLLVGLVAAEAGKKGYSPKYNLKTYGNPLGTFFGGNGNSGSVYPLYGLPGYRHDGYANNFYGLGSPLHYGSHVGYTNYGAQGGFPGYGFMNGRDFNGISSYGNYGVHGNGIVPFKGYAYGRGLGGYGGLTSLNSFKVYGIGSMNGYGAYGIGGLNGYGLYGGLNGYGSYGGLNGYGSYGDLNGYGAYGSVNGYGAYGLGGLNGHGSHGISGISGFKNGRYGYSGVGGFGKFVGKLSQII